MTEKSLGQIAFQSDRTGFLWSELSEEMKQAWEEQAAAIASAIHTHEPQADTLHTRVSMGIFQALATSDHWASNFRADGDQSGLKTAAIVSLRAADAFVDQLKRREGK